MALEDVEVAEVRHVGDDGREDADAGHDGVEGGRGLGSERRRGQIVMPLMNHNLARDVGAGQHPIFIITPEMPLERARARIREVDQRPRAVAQDRGVWYIRYQPEARRNHSTSMTDGGGTGPRGQADGRERVLPRQLEDFGIGVGGPNCTGPSQHGATSEFEAGIKSQDCQTCNKGPTIYRVAQHTCATIYVSRRPSRHVCGIRASTMVPLRCAQHAWRPSCRMCG